MSSIDAVGTMQHQLQKKLFTKFPEKILKIPNMVLVDRRLKLGEIMDAIGISQDSVVSVVNENLIMKKVSAKWVQRMLTIGHRRNHVTHIDYLQRDRVIIGEYYTNNARVHN